MGMWIARLGLLVCLLIAASVRADDNAAKEKDEGFRPLFNGSDLTGWEGAEKDASACWLVDGGDLVCTGKPGPWLRSIEQFGDFELRLEYKLKEGGNSGVYIRVPKDGNHHGEGAGIEVQVLDDNAERYKDLKAYQYTGSLYAIVAAEPRVSKPAGEWNTMTIRCEGMKYVVQHNGQQVIKSDEAAAPELAKRLTKGYLGLQNHNEEVRFRNLRIKLLTPPEDKAPPEEK
jgi:hypothetical protein